MSNRCIVVASELHAHARRVWARVSTLDGVNEELAPLVRMTAPSGLAARSLEEAPVNAPIFTSTLLAFGVVPFDRHSLRLERVVRGAGFVERSSSWLQREWVHERRVEPLGENRCRVIDRVTPVPRIAFATPIALFLVARIFAHRHERLRGRFGGSAVEPPEATSPLW